MQALSFRKVLATTALAVIPLSGAALAQTPYTTTVIQSPADPSFTLAFGINNAGTVVGTHNATANQGFVRSPSGMFFDINFAGAAQTQITGVASNGNTVGIFVDQGGVTHGFAQTGTNFTAFDQPNTAFNQLLGISADASMFAGYGSTDPAGQIGQLAYVGSIANNTFTDVNYLLPSNSNSQATGVNNAGTVVGFYQPTGSNGFTGFEDSGGNIRIINPFGSLNTQALGIATNGEIVGTYIDTTGFQHGYTDIGGVFSTFDPTGSTSTTINGVNDFGQIVGFSNDATGNTLGFEATPVDEPASIAMFGAGLLGLAGFTRRRRSA